MSDPGPTLDVTGIPLRANGYLRRHTPYTSEKATSHCEVARHPQIAHWEVGGGAFWAAWRQVYLAKQQVSGEFTWARDGVKPPLLAKRGGEGVIFVDDMTDKVLGVIPAHLESLRLPRKPMRPICGQPMIAWVYHRARRAACLDHLLVATDAEEIFDYCRKSNIPALMTSTAHRSGTDRIVEVMSRERADVYVNIQGDEPMVTAEHIHLLLRPFHEAPVDVRGPEVSTLKVAIEREEALSSNNVKVVVDATGRALYFSRALIPHDRDGAGAVQYYKHLGFYAYTAAALEKFQALPPSPLEQLEKLEQLRFLENNVAISVVETTQDTVGVDTEEDLQHVEEYFRRAEGAPALT